MMEGAFDKPFDEQLEFFRQKGFEISPDSWRDVWQAAHARAFTVARVTSMDVLRDIREELDKAMESGITLQQFKKNLIPTLQRKGWWKPPEEKEIEILPDGTERKRLAGYRLRTIYRVNLNAAYQVGRYKQLQEVKEARPFWQYRSQMDPAVRDQHRRLNGKVYHADHPFWDKWYPPNGFNCRCYVKSLSERQMKARGLAEETSGVDIKPDEGWNYNVGKAGLDDWKPDFAKYTAEEARLLKEALKETPAPVEAAIPKFVPAKTIKEAEEWAKKEGAALVKRGQVTLDMLNAFNSELSKMPQGLRDKIRNAGGTIRLIFGKGVSEDPLWNPQWKGFKNVPGAGGQPNQHNTRILINSLYRNHASVNLVLHEHAHTLDSITGKRYSDSVEWIDLFSIKGYRDALRKRGGSYISSNTQRGREEAFAETFAYYFHGGESRTWLKDRLPDVYALFETWEKRFK